MAEVLRLSNLVRKLEQRLKDARSAKKVSIAVGYVAMYALYVHEAVDMKLAGQPRKGGKGSYWDPQGKAQAKFLEQPARQLSDDGTLGGIAEQLLRKGKSLEQALLAAGLRLQRESQQLVPVDSGNLRASAFTRSE